MRSKFFRTISWDFSELVPPYVPKIKKVDDCRYIEDYYLEEEIESMDDTSHLSPEDKKAKYINGFSFSTEDNRTSLYTVL